MIAIGTGKCGSIVPAVAALLLGVAPSAQASRYVIEDLGTSREGLPRGLNSHGVIVGVSSSLHALMYRGGKWHWLPDGDGRFSDAYDVNEFNEVAGEQDLGPEHQVPVVWGPGKARRVLPLPGDRSGRR